MTIDVQTETLISFNDARSAFRDGRRKSLATLHRYRLNGVRGVKLETVLIGGLRYTSEEAVDRFIAALNADDAPSVLSVPAMTPARRQRQSEAALVELERMGVAR